MRITESRIRQIIREETKNVVSESTRMTLLRLTADLNKAGEERLADRIGGRRPQSHLDSVVRFRNVGDVVKVYFVSPEGTSQYIDDIPMDVARKLGLEESRRRAGKRTIRESHDDGRWLVSNSGYEFEGSPDLERAWDMFTRGVKALEPFMHDKFEDTESGDMASVGEIAAHQVQTFLTER